MDIFDGNLFNIFRKEWATDVQMEPENDGRVGAADGSSHENVVATEPPEWIEPFKNIFAAFGAPPPSPQDPTPSRHGHPPSRHGYPPAQPEQPATARFPAPARTVAIQHCRRLSVYPFLPEWPGQAAANSDMLYGCVSSQDMVRRIKKINKKGWGGAHICFGLPFRDRHFQSLSLSFHLSPFPNEMKLSDQALASFLQTAPDPTVGDRTPVPDTAANTLRPELVSCQVFT